MTAKAKKRNVRGKSGDVARGSWCTAKPVAMAIGSFDLDPFSNPRSHIVSAERCMLEVGGDGFGDGTTPGSYRTAAGNPFRIATASSSTWLQPDYAMVQRAIDHYAHTRFVALLRFDQRTDWFKRLYARCEAIRVLWDAEFEPPPGIAGGAQSFPHALFYKHAEDVTDEVRRISFGWTKKRKD